MKTLKITCPNTILTREDSLTQRPGRVTNRVLLAKRRGLRCEAPLLLRHSKGSRAAESAVCASLRHRSPKAGAPACAPFVVVLILHLPGYTAARDGAGRRICARGCSWRCRCWGGWRTGSPFLIPFFWCSVDWGLASFPGCWRIRVNPDIIFTFFLPPLLFPAALFMPWRDFRTNLRPILLLAIGRVLFTKRSGGVAWERFPRPAAGSRIRSGGDHLSAGCNCRNSHCRAPERAAADRGGAKG